MLQYDCVPRAGSPAAAVLLHPHPDMGGNRFHPVIDACYRGLALTTLRFDFSTSAVAGAQAQVVEALDLVPEGQAFLVGYSFGADIALSIDDPRVLGWFLIAPPLRLVEPSAMAATSDPRPKRLAVPERDQFCPPSRAAELTRGWEATSVVTVSDSDHFLVGRGPLIVEEINAWLRAV